MQPPACDPPGWSGTAVYICFSRLRFIGFLTAAVCVKTNVRFRLLQKMISRVNFSKKTSLGEMKAYPRILKCFAPMRARRIVPPIIGASIPILQSIEYYFISISSPSSVAAYLCVSPLSISFIISNYLTIYISSRTPSSSPSPSHSPHPSPSFFCLTLSYLLKKVD